MKRLLATVFLASALLCPGAGPHASAPVPPGAISVSCGDVSGSGLVFRSGGRAWVWTCAHVVESAADVTAVVLDGRVSVIARFSDVDVYLDEREGGMVVRRTSWRCRIARYSAKHDLALLEVRLRGESPASLPGGRFARGGPVEGEAVRHHGNILGRMPSSLVNGLKGGSTMARSWKADRLFGEVLWARYELAAHPGCSGGPIFDSSGACVGLMTSYAAGKAHGHMLAVPVERLRGFARAAKCLWAADASVEPPAVDREHPYRDPIAVPIPLEPDSED